MKLRQAIPTGVTASAVVHLSVLGLVLLLSEVRPLRTITTETVAVDIVTPQEIAKAEAEPVPEPAPTAAPLPDVATSEKVSPIHAREPAPAKSRPAPSQKQVAAPIQTARQQAGAQPGPAPPTAAYTQPEPDISIKYHVMLGLPPDIPLNPPPAGRFGDKAGDNFDAPATKAADLEASLVAQFRRHLRTCSKLPASLSRADDIKVTLRVQMTREGRLATEPVLIEASASTKGPVLLRSAISALVACQPYGMLPADHYDEWKVIDLNFTPQDFS